MAHASWPRGARAGLSLGNEASGMSHEPWTHEPLTIPDGLMDKGIIKPAQKQIKTN